MAEPKHDVNAETRVRIEPRVCRLRAHYEEREKFGRQNHVDAAF